MTGGAVAIRDFTEADRPAVEALYAEVFGERTLEPWRRRFEWQFLRSPGTRLRPSRLWVAERGGRVIGFLSSFPMRLQLGGREFGVLCPCDLMVSSAARGLGLGQKLIETYLAAGPVLANALQYSEAAERIYDRLGYAAVPAEPIRLRPRDFGRLLEFRRAGREPASPLRAFAETLGGAFAGAGAALMNASRRPRRAHGVTVTEASAVGEEFDAYWQGVCGRFPAVVVRDREFVRWRYLDDPLRRSRLLVARNAEGRMLGHAGVMTAERRGVTFGYLLDVVADPASVDAIDTLVAEALARCEAGGAAVVSSLGLLPPIRERVAWHLWWAPKARQKPARFLWQGDPALAPLVTDAASWHLSHADGDEAFSL